MISQRKFASDMQFTLWQKNLDLRQKLVWSALRLRCTCSNRMTILTAIRAKLVRQGKQMDGFSADCYPAQCKRGDTNNFSSLPLRKHIPFPFGDLPKNSPSNIFACGILLVAGKKCFRTFSKTLCNKLCVRFNCDFFPLTITKAEITVACQVSESAHKLL